MDTAVWIGLLVLLVFGVLVVTNKHHHYHHGKHSKSRRRHSSSSDSNDSDCDSKKKKKKKKCHCGKDSCRKCHPVAKFHDVCVKHNLTACSICATHIRTCTAEVTDKLCAGSIETCSIVAKTSTVSGNSTTGSLTVNGPATINGVLTSSSTTTGALSATSVTAGTVTAGAITTGTLNVTSDAAVGGDLTVGGTIFGFNPRPVAHFYALMPPDNAAPVAVGSAVEFPQDGPTTTAGITRASASTFTLADIGTYSVSWQVSVDEAGQLAIALNGLGIARTVVGRDALTSQIVGPSILVTTGVVNTLLSIVNPLGNVGALTITPLAGGLNPVAATLTIERIA